ncbi:CvfB family protein [Gorillibacterium timonense]|uniref:CvfB family protein n=1 Tax=Gorillibacterium timonense TaxID=1689269 RepID=UPI00071D10BB|nr:S1-like domain-containing RNA-binding protein [Gorillibacterium timonense]
MTIEAGQVLTLRVAKEVPPYGYFVTDGTREVLLHYTEKTRDIKPGESVKVFLYYDTEDRLSATMKEPLIRLNEVALLTVVDIHPRIGTFLDMGLGRNLLLPFSEQPELVELRPLKGDRVWVVLAHDRQGRLVAKLAGEKELIPLSIPAPTSWLNKWLDARVYKPLQMGTFVVIDGGVAGFGAIGMIHTSERTRMLRVGEAVKVRPVFIREDGRANVSMRESKEKGREEDSTKVLELLKARPGGAMPYSDSTQADIIMTKFGISKGAFKRALGKLMKDGLIEQRENWTYLTAAGKKLVESETRQE